MDLPDTHAARRFLEEGDDFVLTSHINSDGDGIGGCLALRRLLSRMGKKATVILHDPPDDHYDFLADWELLEQAAEGPQEHAEYVAILDCPSLERVGDVQKYIGGSTRILNIDHHKDNHRFGEVNLVSSGVSSSSEMLYHLASSMDLEIDAETAAQLYTGILFDTGGFRYSLTTPVTFEVAADLVRRGIRLDRLADQLFGNKPFAQVKQLGRALDSLALHFDGRVAVLRLDYEDMRAGDPEEIVNYGLLVKGVEVSMFMREQEPGKYRISLRAKERVDVSQIAARFGGGGHPKASGCRLTGDGNDIERELLSAIEKHL